MYTGIAASDGVAIGRAYLIKEDELKFEQNISEQQIDSEIARLKQALEKSKEQVIQLQEQITNKVGNGNARIFEAHLEILKDPELNAEVERYISSGKTAEWAVKTSINNYAAILENLENEFMKERTQDIRDIGKRLINNLQGKEQNNLTHLQEPVVIVAREITPSDTAQLDKTNTLGFVTDTGGRTSHSAIMARTMEIPAVVGVKNISDKVKNGDLVIVDGNKGCIYVNPDEIVIEEYTKVKSNLEQEKLQLAKTINLPAETLDNHRVELYANIGGWKEAASTLTYGAEGVGLFRTEFLFMDRDSLPSEEEQFEAYRKVAQVMANKVVIIRTLDIGGDKELPYLKMIPEANPFLGVRAIRLCFQRPDIFKTQLRAILRASVYGNIQLMYPMITRLEDVLEANVILNQEKKKLQDEGVPINSNMKVGIMVEIPSVAVAADIFASNVDFFSIGTNDLIQYTLAVDRMNESLSHLYDYFNPAILRLIKNVIDQAHKHQKSVGICGEMAGDPQAALILLGLGLDEFSMSASSIPKVKRLIHSCKFETAKSISNQVLAMVSSTEITQYINTKASEFGL